MVRLRASEIDTQPQLIRDQNRGRQTSRSAATIEMSWKSTSAIVNSKSQLLPGKEGSQSAVTVAGPQAYPRIRPALSSGRSLPPEIINKEK